jgi:hypothetical protein
MTVAAVQMPQGEKLAPEWKVRIMKNEKTESSGVVESVSRFTGAFVGALLVGGKKMANCINDMTKPKLETKPEQTPKPKAEPKPEIEPVQKLEPMPKPIQKSESKASKKIAEKSVKSPLEKKSRPTAKDKKKITSRHAHVKKKAKAKQSSNKSSDKKSVETN